MASIPYAPGVYQIRCIPTGKVYIGGTSNLHKRWLYHARDLRVGVHTITVLQADYNTYGADAIEFVILEQTEVAVVHDREQYWLDRTRAYDPLVGYNKGRNARFAFAGLSHTPEARKRISEANKRSGRVITPEQRAKMVAGIRRPEVRAKNRASRIGKRLPPEKRQHYIMTDPSGRIYHVDNIAVFCAEHGLSHGNLIGVAQGQRKQHKGWVCAYDYS